MDVSEWNRAEALFTVKYGWDDGHRIMHKIRHRVSFKQSITDFNARETQELRKKLRKEIYEK